MTTRERLFAAAKNIYERDGLESLTIRAVGREAGLSAMTIYRYFPDKETLTDALMHDGFAAWEAIVSKIDCNDPILWLKRAIARYGDFALTHPHRFDAAFLFSCHRPFPVKIEAERFSVIKSMIVQIEKAQTQGRLADVAPLELALLISGLAQGLVSMHRTGHLGNDEKFRASYHVAMDRLLASFKKSEAVNQSARMVANPN